MSKHRAEEGTGRDDDTGGHGTTVLARTDINRRLRRTDTNRGLRKVDTDWRLRETEDLSEQLLPGLSNDITLDLITPRLPWKEIISTLALVSRAWQFVIRSRQVYNARVRSHSTERFVIFDRYVRTESRDSIPLYSPTEKSFWFLPPIPRIRRGFPSYCRCVSLHGKIYILGGLNVRNFASKNVYVLDLYGQRQWKRCANMRVGRLNFGCCVFDGKIYVFGGSRAEETYSQPGCYADDAIKDSETYDPEIDAWLRIRPLPSFQAHQRVAIVGEELYVYGGLLYGEIYVDWASGGPVSGDPQGIAPFLEIYNPLMNKWRRIEWLQGEGDTRAGVFFARGKFYSLTQFAIHLYDIEKKSWTQLHTCSFAIIGPDNIVSICPAWTAPVDDELLVRINVIVKPGPDTDLPDLRSYLLQSRGFGSETETIVWDRAEGSPSLRDADVYRSDILAFAEP